MSTTRSYVAAPPSPTKKCRTTTWVVECSNETDDLLTPAQQDYTPLEPYDDCPGTTHSPRRDWNSVRLTQFSCVGMGVKFSIHRIVLFFTGQRNIATCTFKSSFDWRASTRTDAGFVHVPRLLIDVKIATVLSYFAGHVYVNCTCVFPCTVFWCKCLIQNLTFLLIYSAEMERNLLRALISQVVGSMHPAEPPPR
jgi:hypothetical protein